MSNYRVIWDLRLFQELGKEAFPEEMRVELSPERPLRSYMGLETNKKNKRGEEEEEEEKGESRGGRRKKCSREKEQHKQGP